MVVSPRGRLEVRGGFGRQTGEEFGDRAALPGEHEVGTEVGERAEDETPRGQPRMGKGEGGGVEDEVAAAENVEIERARAVACAHVGAAARAFEAGEAGEERRRGQRGVEGDDGVEKGGGAGRAIHGGGFIDGGDGGGCRSLVQGEQKIASGPEVGQTIAEVRAEGDEGAHGESLSGPGCGGERGGLAGAARSW